MDLSKIISVTGKSGLFRVVAPGRQAIIAESLEDGKRIPVPTSVRVSTLDEISMFTTGEDVPLKEVLAKLFEIAKGGPAADPKSDDATLWKNLTAALPTADKERIYASDVRKLFLWYGQLLKAGIFTQEEETKEEESADKAKSDAKAKKAAEQSSKAKADIAGKKGGKASAGPAKGAAPRRGGQRGS